MKAKIARFRRNFLSLHEQQFVLSLLLNAERRKDVQSHLQRKVGTTKSTMLPNGKAPGIKRPGRQTVPQKMTAPEYSGFVIPREDNKTVKRGKGENAV